MAQTWLHMFALHANYRLCNACRRTAAIRSRNLSFSSAAPPTLQKQTTTMPMTWAQMAECEDSDDPRYIFDGLKEIASSWQVQTQDTVTNQFDEGLVEDYTPFPSVLTFELQ